VNVSTGVKATAWSVVLLTAYVGGSIIMWRVAFNLGEDRSRAAMIGAASAFSTAGAAVLGGWFTARRTSRLQQAREDKEKRRDAYVRVLGALADYGRACTDVLDFQKISKSTLPPGEEGETTLLLARENLVAAQAHARAVLVGLEQAFAAVDLVATPRVRRAMASLKERIDEAPPGEAVMDDSTSSQFVAEARRDLDT
jgi:hypothetical protein